MKMNVEIEIDWLDEDMSIDEVFKDEIMNALSRKLTSRIEIDMNNQVNEAIQESISKQSEQIEIATTEFLSNICKEKFESIKIPTKKSTWDNEVTYTPIAEYIGKLFEQSMENTKVDDRGNIARYSSDAKTTLMKYITQNYLEKELNKKVVDMIQGARQDAEQGIIKTLETTLKDQLSTEMISKLNIPKMLKALQDQSKQITVE